MLARRALYILSRVPSHTMTNIFIFSPITGNRPPTPGQADWRALDLFAIVTVPFLHLVPQGIFSSCLPSEA